jgi:hypothetical protein
MVRGMVCCTAGAERGSGKVKGHGTDSGGGGSGSGLCHVDEPLPHATPHLTDATSLLGSWPRRPCLLSSCQLEKSLLSTIEACHITHNHHHEPSITAPSPAAAYQHTPQTQPHPHSSHPTPPSPHPQDTPSAASSQPSYTPSNSHAPPRPAH